MNCKEFLEKVKKFLIKNKALVLIPVVLILAVLIIICINSFNNRKIQREMSFYEQQFANLFVPSEVEEEPIPEPEPEPEPEPVVEEEPVE